MNRRNFINKGLAITAAFGLKEVLLTGTAEAKPIVRKNRIGIQLYSIKDSLPNDFRGSLQKLADIGYTRVEAYGFDSRLFLGKSLKEVQNVLDGMGMQLSGTHCGTGLLPADTQAEEWDYWRRSIGEMQAAGGRHLVQSFLPAAKTVDELKRVAEQYNKIGDLCKRGGVKFGYHNHHAEFKVVEGEVILDVLLQNTDPKLVFFQLDLGHAVNGGGDILSCLQKYPKRFLSWHASDFKKGQGYTEVGKGDVPYDELFKLAKSYGLEDLTVEQETDGDVYASCKIDYDYLAKYSWTKVGK
ncbi:MAG: sugar phosphate isomerase/epimerase [Tannerella sp.]|jgi:sugar phosphate isomerase/epimerase|nr:sugar phosphate isomerase/epimerase [Tannerella sp.]